MYPVSSWVERQLGVSHSVAGRLWASVSGSGFVVPLQMRSGEVKVDASSPAKRQLDATVIAPVDSPAVDPFSAEVRAEYAVIAPNGQTEWVPVGTFVVTDAQEESPGVVKLHGIDRWQRLVDARFEQPYATSGVTADTIAGLVAGADSRITVDTSRAPAGSHGSALWERERTDAVLDLARSIGAVVRFDPLGVAVVEPQPRIDAAPVWQVSGGGGGVLVRSRRGVSREQTYNAVTVVGEPPDSPAVYATARDESESSKTRWGGRFGKRTRFMRSQLITTEAQAQAAADALLQRVLGVARTLEVESLPHPGLDAGDPLLVESAPGVWERHLVEAFTLPLGPGTVTIATRAAAEDVEGTE